jgi:hypothetical protein
MIVKRGKPMATKEEAEKILESLSQEERLKLLERLIQGAEEVKEEELTVEQRLERLEGAVLSSHRSGKRIIVKRMRGDRLGFGDIGACGCCL